MRGVILFMLMEHKRNNRNMLLNRLQDSSSKASRYHIYEESGMPAQMLERLALWEHCLDAVYQLDGVGSDIGRSSWLLLVETQRTFHSCESESRGH